MIEYFHWQCNGLSYSQLIQGINTVCLEEVQEKKRQQLFLQLLHCSQRGQSMLLSRLSSNLDDEEADKIPRDPIAAMCTQHVQVLNLQWSSARAQEKVHLKIVVEKPKFLLCNLLPREVVGVHFYGGTQSR